MSKFGRNDPCHCGSGKKYKKCCLSKTYTEVAKKIFTEKGLKGNDYKMKGADHGNQS